MPGQIADNAQAMSTEPITVSRRDLLSLIGAVSGSAAMYHAMTSLGFASESTYKGPIRLEGDAKGASVLMSRIRCGLPPNALEACSSAL